MKLSIFLFACMLAACSNKRENNTDPGSNGKNFLTMKIDGSAWAADNEVSGSYHVTEELGPGMLTFSGQKGKGSTQQDFVVNLYNTNGPGTYTVNIVDKQATYQNVTQFAMLTQSNYLCGGALQASKLTVTITKASKEPQELAGTFSGSMQCVEGNTINITEGKFYYHE